MSAAAAAAALSRATGKRRVKRISMVMASAAAAGTCGLETDNGLDSSPSPQKHWPHSPRLSIYPRSLSLSLPPPRSLCLSSSLSCFSPESNPRATTTTPTVPVCIDSSLAACCLTTEYYSRAASLFFVRCSPSAPPPVLHVYLLDAVAVAALIIAAVSARGRAV